MAGKGGRPRSRATREERLRLVRQLADNQGGVVSRDQLRGMAITPAEIEAHLRAGASTVPRP